MYRSYIEYYCIFNSADLPPPGTLHFTGSLLWDSRLTSVEQQMTP